MSILTEVLNRCIPDMPPEPPATEVTVIYVITGKSHKRRHRRQEVLFPTNRVIVRRSYDKDGRLIAAELTPLTHIP